MHHSPGATVRALDSHRMPPRGWKEAGHTHTGRQGKAFGKRAGISYASMYNTIHRLSDIPFIETYTADWPCSSWALIETPEAKKDWTSASLSSAAATQMLLYSSSSTTAEDDEFVPVEEEAAADEDENDVKLIPLGLGFFTKDGGPNKDEI